MDNPVDSTYGTITRAIADFATGIHQDTISENASGMLKLSLIDWLSVAVAGQNEPVSRIVRDFVEAEGGTCEATVIGTSKRLPARAAALANGTCGHSLDYDDTHFAYLGHPSAAVLPAALALAQKTGAGGEQFIIASLIGVETATRIGTWMGRRHHAVGFHSTATAGAFGAAMASARLLGLDREKAAYAFGLVATRASGLRAHFGTMGKPFHAGMAASNGVEAALLAQAGFVSRPDALESAQGFAVTHEAEMRDPAEAITGLGQSWEFEKVLHKYHACCHGIHASLEALKEAQDSRKVRSEKIATISISVSPRYLNVCNIPEPQTGLEAKFSYRLCAAMIMAGRDTAALSTYCDAACREPKLVALRDRVAVFGDDRLADTEASVVVTLTDGQVLPFNHDISNPIDYEIRREKIRSKSRALLGGKAADALWAIAKTAEPARIAAWVQKQDG